MPSKSKRGEGASKPEVPGSIAPITQLDVYYDELLVGTLSDTEPLAFEYSEQWLGASSAFSLPGIPLAPGRIDSAAVAAVFDNLLPEGALRDYIGRQRHASTLFSMLRELAGDTAGALSILPHGEKPSLPTYEKINWQELAALLHGERATSAIDINTKDARISLSGAQEKLLIAIDHDGEPMLPIGESPSTHIVKPDIKHLPKVHHSAINETIVMLTAAKAGVQTAEVFYEPTTRACVVKRFDRLSQHGRLIRLRQYDFCQLDGTISDRKYEPDGGPGIVRCAQLLREYSARPALDLERMLGWIFFNLYVGNNDSHAKNLSVHHLPQQGTVLAPFYDLMCTRVYSGLSGTFAFAIGGENHPGDIAREHVVRMASELGFRADHVLGVAEQVAACIKPALEETMSQVQPLLARSGKILAQRLQWKILEMTEQFSKRILGARR